ncbi:MAG: rubrerythrin family protein [Bacteroidetes bacterium 43-16]|nr:MAG: rubrerythrin family protein [Bacteroidetes bacterium 43-16]
MNNESQVKTAASPANKNTAVKPGNDTGSLRSFFIDGLKDMFWAEKAIIPGLQKLQKLSTCEQLSDAFETHEQQTQKHIARLEKVFQMLGEKAEAKKCKAMEGILKEVDEMVEATPEYSATRDAIAIIAAQKVEHYEIASYGGLVALGHTLGLSQVANMLQKTLDEEEQTDLNLTDIAESHINFEAEQETEPETAAAS